MSELPVIPLLHNEHSLPKCDCLLRYIKPTPPPTSPGALKSTNAPRILVYLSGFGEHARQSLRRAASGLRVVRAINRGDLENGRVQLTLTRRICGPTMVVYMYNIFAHHTVGSLTVVHSLIRCTLAPTQTLDHCIRFESY